MYHMHHPNTHTHSTHHTHTLHTTTTYHPTGVTCLDFHPSMSHVLVVGGQDGSVAVYDVAPVVCMHISIHRVHRNTHKKTDKQTNKHPHTAWSLVMQEQPPTLAAHRPCMGCDMATR